MSKRKFKVKSQVDQLPADVVQHIQAVVTSDSVKSVATNILVVAGYVGAIGLLLTAPNTLKLFAPLFRRQYHRPLTKSEQRQKFLKSLYYLKQSGQISIEEKEGGLLARLTSKGIGRWNRITSEVHSIEKPVKWDGRWWLVAADIPTKQYRIAADMFRLKLRELKLYPLQRTLWMYPHDPRRELQYVVTKYGIGKFVTVMEVNRIDTQDRREMLTFFKQKHIL